uniref:Tim44 domain-containing protein n=1 Tax=Desulfobacca acetoxidans TaxID=60893 RepID=A0A7V4GAA0_9BACT
MHARRRWLYQGVTILFLLMFLTWTLPLEALARAGRGMSGGGSMGSRGSRTTAPVKPYTPPSATTPRPTTPSPSPGAVRPTPTPTPTASPTASSGSSFWRGMAGGIVGGLFGGMVARWLFGGSGSAHAAPGAESSSFPWGLVILIGIGILVFYLIKKKREAQTALEGAYQSSGAGGVALQPPYYDQLPSSQSEAEADLDRGLSQIQQMDPLFTEDRFRDLVMDNFFKIQGAWSDRDMSSVKHLLTDEMYRILQEDAAKMRADGIINKLENIAVREVNLTEAWQEAGQDFITVRVYANLLDYSVDEKTGEVVAGSKTDPVKFEEYWTFVRAVGNNPWKLTAINQAA